MIIIEMKKTTGEEYFICRIVYTVAEVYVGVVIVEKYYM